MFKKYKQYPAADTHSASELPYAYGESEEWEEIIEEDAAEPHAVLPEYEIIESDPVPTFKDVPGYPTYAYESDERGIELDGGVIDVTEFPALRLVFDQEEDTVPQQPEQKPEGLLEYTAQSDGEDGLSWLIRRYAELDEQEEAAAQQENEAAKSPGEELPELFRVGERGEVIQTEEEEEIDDFTMESELEKQRHISGELFEYISTIESEHAEDKRRRAQSTVKVRKHDPYNMSFNSRFDNDTDDLEDTPEIAIPNKYEFTSGGEDA